MARAWMVSVEIKDRKIQIGKSHYVVCDNRFGSESHCGLHINIKTLAEEAEAKKTFVKSVLRCENCEKAFVQP